MSTKIVPILAIVASMITAVTTMSIPVLADKSSAQNGINTADVNVHNHTPGGFTGKQDLNFHVGTCNGGISTTALNGIGGCSILPSPSEFHSH
jgi:hypothetical protein